MATFLLQTSAYWYNGTTYAKDQDGTIALSNQTEGEERKFSAHLVLTPSFSTNFITHSMIASPLNQQRGQDSTIVPKGSSAGFNAGFN